MATLGEQLRAAREHARLTVEEAAALTHIPREHLLSLESDDVTALPGLPFARGFIRIYADILKVPAEPLLAAHAAQLGEAQYDLRAQPGAARPGLGAVHVGVVLAAVAIAVVVAVLLLTRSAEPSAAGPAPAADAAQSTDALAAGTSIELVAVRDVELTVIVDGNEMLAGEIQAGERRSWTPIESISVRAMPGAALEVVIDGESQGVIGADDAQVDHTWQVAAPEAEPAIPRAAAP